MSRAVALAYHAVTSTWPHPLAIRPENLRAQLYRLAELGFNGVTLSELARGVAGAAAVAVTFDDGFASVATAAKPILDELGWVGTVFAVTDAVGRAMPMLWLGGPSGDHDHERLPLDWDDLGRLAASGWEVGSHGRTHRLLSALADDDLADELEGSRDALRGRGFPCASISYPHGELDERVIAAARRAGFTAGSGLAGRFRFGDPMCVPRVAVDGRDGALRFAVKTSGWFASARATQLWTVLDAVRRPGRPLGV